MFCALAACRDADAPAESAAPPARETSAALPSPAPEAAPDQPRGARDRSSSDQSQKNEATAPDVAPHRGQLQGSAPSLPTVQRSRHLMGTIIQLTVVGESEARAGPVLTAALDEMQRLESILSEWREDSEISQINRAAGDHPVKVSEDTLANVRLSLEVSKWSDGAYDLSWAALRGLYLFQPGQERVPSDAELKARLPLVNYKNIVLDEKARTVFLRKKGMLLGTGGIAKGYALEQAAKIVEHAGFQNYMFFGGGQVVVHGKKGDRGWRVGVQHPRANDYFGFIESEHGSIATSGDYEHAFVMDGQRWHHIIDLKTGKPVQHTSAVTVISDSPFYADAIDTALFIMGPKKAFQKLPSAPGPKAEALLVERDLTLHVSPGMRERLNVRVPLSADSKLPAN
jgi:FAD:protein FMN transferase